MAHPPDKVDEALLAYRLTGSTRKAEAQTGVDHSVIALWVRDTHAARYQQLCDKHGPAIEAQLVARMQAVADQAADVAADAVQATRDAVQQADGKNAAAMSTTARNLMLSAGIATDKSQLIQGKPTEIHGNTTADDDLKALARMFNVTLEGTAQDITDQHQGSALGRRSPTLNARELEAGTSG